MRNLPHHELIAALVEGLSSPDDITATPWLDSCLQADEHERPWPHGTRVLDACALSESFIPTAWGGRLSSAESLIEIMRTIARYDPSLALGHGGSTLIAATNVWTAGNDSQKAAVAGLLRDKGRLACGYHELDHGNDLMHLSCRATSTPQGGWRIEGAKQAVAGIHDAPAMVLMVQTAPPGHGRSHSLLLAHRDDFRGPQPRSGTRFRTVGMRGVQLGELRFDGCELPASALLGTVGQGAEIALKAFQVTRIVLPGMFTGVLEGGLLAAVGHLSRRHLYGRNAIDIPSVRATLASAYADLLLANAFVRVAARLLNDAPHQVSTCANAVKYLVPGVLIHAMERLSALMGAFFYVRGGEHAHMQKLVRDIKPVGFGHASRTACLMALASHLPGLIRKGWRQIAPLPLGVITPSGPPGALDFSRLAMFGGADPLASGLRALHEDLCSPRSSGSLALDDETRLWTVELDDLLDTCQTLPAEAFGLDGSLVGYPLAARHARIQAASACLHDWQRARCAGTAFFDDPAWLQAALYRLRHGDAMVAPELPDKLIEPMCRHLLRQSESGRLLPSTASQH